MHMYYRPLEDLEELLKKAEEKQGCIKFLIYQFIKSVGDRISSCEEGKVISWLWRRILSVKEDGNLGEENKD